MRETFSPGDIVKTIHLNNLYQVIEVDAKGRIVCDPITQPHWKDPFIFRPETLKKELPILCPQCTPWSDLLLDVITGYRWACAHKFVEMGYELYTQIDSCPTCLLARPYHTDTCELIKISHNISKEQHGKWVLT